MNIFSRFFRRAPKAPRPKPGLICSDCGARIHHHDNYTVLAVRHKDCRDPKRVGQLAIDEESNAPQPATPMG